MSTKIIKYLDDTDLYKLTMQLFVVNYFPKACVKYKLTMRPLKDGTIPKFTQTDLENIKGAIYGLEDLKYSPRGLMVLATKAPYLPSWFLTYLKGFTLNPREDVTIWLDENSELQIEINGLWEKTIPYETLVMPIISECFFEERAPLVSLDLEKQYEKAKRKGEDLKTVEAFFTDFGTRRRRSFNTHAAVVQGLKDGAGQFYLGSSNVFLSGVHDTTPQGTMAHELFSALAAMYGVEHANNQAIGKWTDLFGGDLGTLLPDTFTTDFFIRTFKPLYAKGADGVRHDSGDPHDFTDKWVVAFDRLLRNTKARESKKIIFSNAINSIEQVKSFKDYVDGRLMPGFGIGTWFTNDFDDLPALNMVIKLVAAQLDEFEPMRHAVKLSDDTGKHNGDPDTVADYFRRINAGIV